MIDFVDIFGAKDLKCNWCKKSISSETFEALDGYCEICYKIALPAINEMTIKNIKKLTEAKPLEAKLRSGKIFCACYLPEMIEFDEKTNNFNIDLGEAGLKRIDNLIGLAGFFYDTEYYFATTPEKVIEAWNWYNLKTKTDEDYWMAVEAETVWDFLRYNWRPFTSNFRESLILNMLSLIIDLYQLDSLKVDVTAKLLEIKNEKIKGNMETYQKLIKNDFQVDIKLVKKAFIRIRKTRQELANLSAESRLALFAKQRRFEVLISKSPDLLINKKRCRLWISYCLGFGRYMDRPKWVSKHCHKQVQ